MIQHVQTTTSLVPTTRFSTQVSESAQQILLLIFVRLLIPLATSLYTLFKRTHAKSSSRGIRNFSFLAAKKF